MIGYSAFNLVISVGILLPLRLLNKILQAVDKRQSTSEYNSKLVAVQSCIQAPGASRNKVFHVTETGFPETAP